MRNTPIPNPDSSRLNRVPRIVRTGCQWNAVPPALAAGSTAHDYFQDWVKRGIFEAVWSAALREYDELVGIDWNWPLSKVDAAWTGR